MAFGWVPFLSGFKSIWSSAKNSNVGHMWAIMDNNNDYSCKQNNNSLGLIKSII